MPKVVLGNIGSNSMAPSVQMLSDQFLQANAAAAKRMIWLANDGDVFITPTPVSKDFLNYVNQLKGGGNIVSLSTSPVCSKRPFPISEQDFAATSDFSKSLSLRRLDSPVSELEPYIPDEVAVLIAKSLGDLPISFSGQRVGVSSAATRILNDKAKFREFASKLGVPIARGYTCTNTQEVVDGVRAALSVSDQIILKMARHSGGDGNIVFTKRPNDSFQGATRTVFVLHSDGESIRTAISDVGLTASVEEPVIVEVYSENENSIGVHFDIRKDEIDLVGVATILFNPGYGGAYWGESLLTNLPTEVVDWCQHLANYAQLAGYRGPLSVDVVKAKGSGFFACEVNGRHGGFSSVRAVSASLKLEGAIRNGSRVVLSRNGVTIGLQFPQLLELLEKKGLHYNSVNSCGVVVAVEGHEESGPFDFVIFERDVDQAVRLEAEILQLRAL
ncbi:preATP grasp domain-containing protein (plasmid) [Rhizobium leguminosarum]